MYLTTRIHRTSFNTRRCYRPQLERLESRTVFASLSGSVAIDWNGNFATDLGDEAVESALVWIDANRNGIADAGEPQTMSGADGRYAFTGLAAGDYEIRMRPTPGLFQTSPSQYFSFYRGSDEGQFGLAEIDVETGSVVPLTPGVSAARQGLIKTTMGEFYAAEQLDGGVYRVDPSTGQQSLVGLTAKEIAGGLAYDPVMDRIYTLAREPGGEGMPLNLFEVDRQTGSLARVGTGAGLTESRSISGMAFDLVNREIVLFDNKLDEFLAYDLSGTGRKLSQFIESVGFYNLAFDGFRFLTFDADSEFASVYEVDVDQAMLWPVRSLEQLVWGDAADMLASNQPWRVHLATDSAERVDLDFLTSQMNVPHATLRVDEAQFHLLSNEKGLELSVSLERDAVPMRFCVGALASDVVVEQSLASSRPVVIETSPHDDRLTINAPPLVRIEMGLGTDTLVPSASMQLDLPGLASQLSGIDVLDLRGTDGIELLSDAESIRAITDAGKLTVLAYAGTSVDLSLEPWSALPPATAGGNRLHQLVSDDVILELDNGLGWRNPLNFLDINADGSVSPLDALLIINLLNQSGSRSLSASDEAVAQAEYIDSSGDNVVSPIDVLLVINHINSRSV